ncbi:MAG TPA: RPA12/RPB9/RPC11 RNA polymerase family protein, partial [Candidatus Bathyarchaeia archaeon]|nr:RPA12/RPB9/RPC11 RNA polymerase family protein [Candidatus Bathyarchaeia archaeon]
MEFCPKCGTRLVPKKGKEGKGATLVMACLKCGYKKKAPEKKTEPKLAETAQPNPKQLVAVISKEEQKLRTLPTVRIECPKCGNNTAYVWQV